MCNQIEFVECRQVRFDVCSQVEIDVFCCYYSKFVYDTCISVICQSCGNPYM